MTPKSNMREYCKQCLNMPQFNQDRVKDCGGDKAGCGACPFYQFRLGRVSVKVFRKNCLYCMGGNRMAVDECSVTDCSCYPYRYGKNPAMNTRKGNTDALRKWSVNEVSARVIDLKSI